MEELRQIASQFKIEGTIKTIKSFGGGLINDTYKVETEEADKPNYVLQRINHNIFQNVDMLQSNIVEVTTHIRIKLKENPKFQTADLKLMTVKVREFITKLYEQISQSI